MRISIWPNNIPNNAKSIYDKLCQHMTYTDTVVESTLDADAALIWSVLWNGKMSGNKRVWDTYRAQNKPVIVIEVGGLVRNTTWRLSINGITRGAIFPTIQKLDYDRPKMFNLNIFPWQQSDYVLICGQHGKSELWKNMPPMSDYFEQTVLEIRKYSDRPIMIRSHPRFRENIFFKINEDFYRKHNVKWNIPNHVSQSYDNFDLEAILNYVYCTVSHSSNSGITSIISGVPAIVSEESLAFDMSASSIAQINSLPMPDREQWLVELSHKEWLEDELGTAWTALRPNLLP